MSDIIKSFKKGFKYRIYPNKEQIDLLNKTFGCVRYVYNRGLSDAKKEYEYYLAHKDTNHSNELSNPNVSGYDFVNKLIEYKNDLESLWLNDVSAVALQQSMLHLGTAYSVFFKKRKGFPKFKSKHGKQSFTLISTAIRLKGTELYIAKSKDPLKIKWSRPLPSEPTSATISKTSSGKFYISFICEYTPIKTNGISSIGIDLGIKDFAILSSGEKVPNPKHLKNKEKHLKRLQRALSKKCKGSKNRNKARLKVSLAHEKVTNQRNDFLHKLSRILVNENQVIGIEKLKVSNMIQNHNLAKSIADASWSRFASMLNYKALESNNCSIVYMSCWYPSTHICSSCNTQLDYKLKLSERVWTCNTCNTTHDRDINAAKNILNHTLATIKEHQIPSGFCKIILAKQK